MLGCGRKTKGASPSARAPVTAAATAGQAQSPERKEQAERVVPRIDRGQVEDRETDPEARVAVATRLEVEARDRDQEDCEVGLRQHPAEERADRIGQEVREA